MSKKNIYIYILNIYLIPLPWGRDATMPRKEKKKIRKKKWIRAEGETIHPNPIDAHIGEEDRRKNENKLGSSPQSSYQKKNIYGMEGVWVQLLEVRGSELVLFFFLYVRIWNTPRVLACAPSF